MPAESANNRKSNSLPPVPITPGSGYANRIGLLPRISNYRLRLSPDDDRETENYEDLQSEFSPLVYSALERYLPRNLLDAHRETKFRYLRDILRRYSCEGERKRFKKHTEYRQKIISNYQPLYRELYQLNPTTFFVPSFLEAFMATDDNRAESIKSIMSEPAPGIYAFNMLQPHFCEMLLAEVENFERWITETNFRIMRPNTMNKYGAVLDDIGMESMLSELMKDFISHISKIFFADVGGYTLDTHHGFVVEYGLDRDVELGFHVDDAEVTLNVCLGKNFSGGELFFRGVRCEYHVHTQAFPEEIFDYSHVPGHAIIHRGRHRHGARATTAGHRANLLLWCRSSVFRELRRNSLEEVSWCGECQREKRERFHQAVAARREELGLVRRGGGGGGAP